MVEVPTISSPTSAMLKNLFMVLDFLFRDSCTWASAKSGEMPLCVEQNCSSLVLCVCRFAEDYRVALQKSYAWTNQVPPDIPDAQGFVVRPRSRRQTVRIKTEVLTLSFWCLNPAVVSVDLVDLGVVLITEGCTQQEKPWMKSEYFGHSIHNVSVFVPPRLSLTWAAQYTASCWPLEPCHPWTPSPLNLVWNSQSSWRPATWSRSHRWVGVPTEPLWSSVST